MMDLHQLTPDLAVSGQITPDDIPALVAAGFRVLINNRPDNEIGPGEDHATMARIAREAGMDYHYIPFNPGEITPQMIADFERAMGSPGPKAAYCRSGNRSTVLWALSQARRIPEKELLETAARAGYDLSAIRPLIKSLAS